MTATGAPPVDAPSTPGEWRRHARRSATRHAGPGKKDGESVAAPAIVSTGRKLHWMVVLFLLVQLVPWTIMLGPIRVSGYRLVLIAFIVPCLGMWLSGKAGRIRLADILIIFYSLWCFIAIVEVHGLSYAMQPAGIIFIETVGAYLLARCFIRSAEDFYKLIWVLFLMVAFLLPLAIIESFSGRDVAKDFLSMFYPTFPDASTEPRWGLRRAQVVFEHPILYGVCTASILALVNLVLGYRESSARRWTMTGIVIAASFLSLSAGPLSALVAQGMLLLWNSVFRFLEQRWKILVSFSFLIGMSAELLSNRSLPAIFISYFSFDEGSARARLNIWDYGTISVMHHPLFGVGFNEWERPSWMSPSVDMFWLIDAIRHGIPAETLMVATFFATVLPIALKPIRDERLNVYRTAYVIAMTGFFLAGWTVYFWNATYVLMLFLLGSGVWIRDAIDADETQESAPPKPRGRAGGTQNYGPRLRLSKPRRSVAGGRPVR